MKITKLTEILAGTIINLAEDMDISDGYCGDFLSNVISKAPSNGCWFTVMTNVNVAAVALLAEIGVIVVCEGAKPEPALIAKAQSEGINLISTKMPIFQAAVCFSK